MSYTPVLAGGMFLAKRWHELDELWPDDAAEPRMCTVCRTPTVWKRPRKRGAATHPLCEGTIFDVVTDELFARIVFALAASLGAAILADPEPAPTAPGRKRLGNPDAGCELCGRSHAALWIAARTWRCPEHPPPNETYRRK